MIHTSAKNSTSCHEHPQHAVHHRSMIEDFKRRFWISSFLTIFILFLSPMIQTILHISLRFTGDLYLLFSLSTVVFFYGGWPFLKGAVFEIKKKNPGMMTLIGMAISIAYFYSTAVVFGLKGTSFFWELATLVDIMLLGHWIEMKSVLGASRSLELLVKMIPSTAHLVRNDKIKNVKIDQLQMDDIVMVKPGEQIPVDGIIIEGTGYINESLLTGESEPVKKQIHSKVIGGSINGNTSIKVKIERLGKDSYLSKVVTMVQEAQNEKSKTQRLADKAAKWLTYVAISSGLITFFVWISLGKEVGFCLERMVTVMVISCPHALGLAIPLVIAVSTTLCAKSGLLIRNRTAFENSRKITTLLFDKTGTLTKGTFSVTACKSLVDAYSADEILQFAASLEQHSEHPIASSIVAAMAKKGISPLSVKEFKNIPGEGVVGWVGKQFVQIGSSSFLKKKPAPSHTKIPLDIATTQVYVFIDQTWVGFISLADEIRADSFEAVRKLKENHIKTIMITGDNEDIAKMVSKELHIDHYYANTLPQDKLRIVKELQAKGEFVAMTGDGVNDAPALAQANVGIAVGSGTDIAAQTADIILVESNPQDILALLLFGKATYNKMVQNLLWALGYNVVAIPLAAGVLSSFGIIISPAMGAVLMSISTVIVAFNARLLKTNKEIQFLQRRKGEARDLMS